LNSYVYIKNYFSACWIIDLFGFELNLCEVSNKDLSCPSLVDDSSNIRLVLGEDLYLVARDQTLSYKPYGY